MANPFDQFDGSAAAGSNPFDQFDHASAPAPLPGSFAADHPTANSLLKFFTDPQHTAAGQAIGQFAQHPVSTVESVDYPAAGSALVRQGTAGLGELANTGAHLAGMVSPVIAPASDALGNAVAQKADAFAGPIDTQHGLVPEIVGNLAHAAPSLAASMAVPELGVEGKLAGALSKVPGIDTLAPESRAAISSLFDKTATLANQTGRAQTFTLNNAVNNPDATAGSTAGDAVLNELMFGLPSIGETRLQRSAAAAGLSVPVTNATAQLGGKDPSLADYISNALMFAGGHAIAAHPDLPSAMKGDASPAAADVGAAAGTGPIAALPRGADFTARAEPIRPPAPDVGGNVMVDASGNAYTPAQGRSELGAALSKAMTPATTPALPAPTIQVSPSGTAMTSADFLTKTRQAQAAADQATALQAADASRKAALGITPDIERSQGPRWAAQQASTDDQRARQDEQDAQDGELAKQGTDDTPPWWMAAHGAELDHQQAKPPTLQDAAAHAQAGAAMLDTDPQALAPLPPTTRIDATRSVPLGGGVSQDGQTIYIDKRIPQFVKVDGVKVDAHDVIAHAHEAPEFPQMDGAGKDYNDAHDVNANTYEAAYLKAKYGVSHDAFNHALEPYLKKALEHGSNAGDIPGDLDRTPYQHGDETHRLLGASGIEALRSEIGWDQVGGKMLRETDTGGEKPEVTGRTPWVGKAGPDGESNFWRMRPEQGGKISEAGAHAAMDKHAAGKPLNAKERRFIEYAARIAKQYDDAFEADLRQYHQDQTDLSDEQLSRARQALREDGIAPADHAEALTVDQLVSRAYDAGADPQDILNATFDGTSADKARALWNLTHELEARHGTDPAPIQQRGEERTGSEDQGHSAVGPARDEPVAGTADHATPARADAERPAQEPAREVGDARNGLFSAPKPSDHLDAAQRAKDAQRNGLTGGKADTGDGGLFDGPRPEQLRVPDRIDSSDEASQQLSRDVGNEDADRLGLRAAVEKALGPVADRVEYLHGYEGLPADMRKGVQSRNSIEGRKGKTVAMYSPATGRVFLFTDKVKTPELAVWSAAHEIAGHEGLRALLGDRLNPALHIARQNPTVLALADEISRQRNLPEQMKRSGKTPGDAALLATEEALAELAAAVKSGNYDKIKQRYGVDVPPGIRERVQAAIANFLKRLKAMIDDLFGKHTFSDADVRDLLEAAWQAAKHKGAKDGEVGSEGHALDSTHDQTDKPRKTGSDADAKHDLVVTHNLSADKLMHALRMGGLPVPSLAITRGDRALGSFGDITLIGRPGLADPKQGAKAYGADIYSPRYPSITYKLGHAALDKLNAKLAPYQATGKQLYGGEISSIDDLIQDKAFKAYAAAGGTDGGRYHDLKRIGADLLREVGADEMLFQGYTNSGNRRYKPHTIDNVVTALKKELRGGEAMNYGVGSLRAKFTPQFRSVDAIRKNKDRLISKQDFEKVKGEIDDELFKIVDALRAGSMRGNKFDFADTVLSVLEDAPRMGLARALESYDIHGVSDDVKQEMAGFLNQLKHLPTEYFEVKHLRRVGIDEFAAAVIPHDTRAPVVQALQDAGLKVVRYQSGDEAARRDAVQAASKEDDLLFSIDPGDDSFDHLKDMPSRRPGESQPDYIRRVMRKNGDEIKAALSIAKDQRAIGRLGMRAMWAKQDRALAIADRAFAEYRKLFDKEDQVINLRTIDQWENGQRIGDADAREFFSTMKAAFDERTAKIQALAPDAMQQLIDNYFPHIWEDSSKALKWYQSFSAKKPLQGDRSFLKARIHATTADGMATGLKPVSTNPVDLAMLKLGQMDKFIAFHEFRQDLQQRGWLRKMDAGERVPAGYARVDDPAFQIAGGLQGYYAVPELIARDINNYLSPSLYRFGAWKALRTVQNVLMSSRLGLSMFHGGFTTMDNMVMHVDVAGRRMMHGDLVGGVQTLLKAPVSLIWSPIEGGKLNRQWLGLKPSDKNTAAVLDMLEQGGAHMKMSSTDYNNAIPKLVKAFRQKSATGTLKEALPALGESISWVIHHWLVPNQKMAARVMLAKFELDRHAGALGQKRGDYAGIINALHPDVLKQLAAHVVDLVDDRLGQMNYDNQFWNKTARESVQALIGAVGWQVGTLRTVTGGARDLAHLWSPPKLLASLDKEGNVQGDMGHVSGRLTYLVTLALMMGGLSAITQYLMTGKGPQEAKDYFFPKTGNKNDDGSDERLQWPSYWSDHYKLATHPLQTAVHKINPSIGMLMEALSNQDYYGTEIRNPDDPWYKQAGEVGAYLAKGFIPYSITGADKLKDASPGRKAANFFGVTKAPASVSRSQFQAFVADKAYDAIPKGSRSQAQAEHTQAMHAAEAAERKGQEPDMTGLTDADRRNVDKAAREQIPAIRFRRLGIEDKLRAYDMATPQERSEYGLSAILLRSNWRKAIRNLPEDEQDAVIAKMQALMH